MGLSNYVPNSRIAQPGVCTSTTRPATPYEGQVIYETDTNRVLVYDASAWVMIADTDAPPALQLVKTQTIGSAVASVTVSDCFNADFGNYRVQLNIESASTTGPIMRMATSGTQFYTSGQWFPLGSGTPTAFAAGPVGQFYLGYVYSGQPFGASFDVLYPNQAIRTIISGQAIGGNEYTHFGGLEVGTAQSTSMTISPSSGTITGGTIRVYGYRNS